jgi:hypothetical protein
LFLLPFTSFFFIAHGQHTMNAVEQPNRSWYERRCLTLAPFVNAKKAFLVLAAFIGIAVIAPFIRQTDNRSSNTQSPTQSIGDAETAKSWARIVLPQLHYLRDPDSLVVEEAGDWQPVRVAYHDWGEVEVSKVTFRAKNGFGGFSRDACYVVWVPSESKHFVFTSDMYVGLLLAHSTASPKAEVSTERAAKKHKHTSDE